jgi:DNA-directed RNA polymerase subunit RPC12/RpoP
MLDAGAFPLEQYENTHTPWRSLCLTCGREITPSHADVGETGNACPYCSQRKVDPDEAATKMRSTGLDPLVPYPGARVPWPSVCLTCEREVRPQWQSIQRGQGGCVYCAEKSVVPSEAAHEMRLKGYEPLEKYPGSAIPWRSIHSECGREVSPTWGTIRSGGGGCRWCAPSGIDFTQPAKLYLVTNADWRAAKIGIAGQGVRRDRIGQHIDNGWKLTRAWRFKTGEQAHRAEQKVLTSWRKAGYPDLVPPEAMPQGGFSETVAIEAVSLIEIDDLVEESRTAS